MFVGVTVEKLVGGFFAGGGGGGGGGGQIYSKHS